VLEKVEAFEISLELFKKPIQKIQAIFYLLNFYSIKIMYVWSGISSGLLYSYQKAKKTLCLNLNKYECFNGYLSVLNYIF